MMNKNSIHNTFYNVSYVQEIMALAKRISCFVAVFCLPGFFGAIQAITLDDISYVKLAGDKVQLHIELSAPMQNEPLSFSIDNPARVVLDFPNTTLGSVKKTLNIGVGVVNSLSAVEAGNRTRVVLNLFKSTPYTVVHDENIVKVTIGNTDVADVVRTPPADTNFADTDSTDVAEQNSESAVITRSVPTVEGIDFRRGDNGEGRVIVDLSDPSTSVDMNQLDSQIMLNFIGVALPSELDRKLDVIDFATPVKEIDSTASIDGVKMEISMVTHEYEHLAYQLNNQFIVEIRPLDKSAVEGEKAKAGFAGERLSLNFQDIEVRAVLQLIADFTGLNMVTSDTVSGNVTLRLKNVPWDQALDIILKAKGLGLRQIDNVIMVAPNTEIAAREKLELEASNQVQELAPLRTEFIQVNYAKASELANLLKTEENNLLSERGSVTIDERTNTLIVQDITSILDGIREVLSKLDIPVRQVLIESRIVNASESFVQDLGVRFGYSSSNRKQSISADGTTASTAREPSIGFGGANVSESFLEGTGGTFLAEDEGLIVDLAVPGAPSAALLVGKIGSYLLQLELSAQIADGAVEDIASPKIITANQRQARIEAGVEIPFQEASASGATTTAFKQAVLALDVTPQITPDDRVLLDLEVTQDTPAAPVIGGIPINTRRVTTQVLVDNGETVVLGGVYSRDKSKSVTRVPFFSELPYIGFLFQRSNIRKSKSELLIFVTPKILKNNKTDKI